jgi:hypothetical protein
MTMTLDDKDLRKFEAHLRKFKTTALPFAHREALNKGAFLGQQFARTKVIPEKMTLRNKWVQNSIRVKKANQKNVRDQFALLGSIDESMARQEFGSTRVSQGKHGVPIPTRSASSEGRGTSVRKRLVSPARTLRRIKIRPRPGTANRAQRTAIAIKQAAGSGRRFVALDVRRGRQAIYKVAGSLKKPKLEMMWDLSRKTVRTPVNPWLQPTIALLLPRMPLIYKNALEAQISRHRLFRSL